jgi:hypothetical protein
MFGLLWFGLDGTVHDTSSSIGVGGLAYSLGYILNACFRNLVIMWVSL